MANPNQIKKSVNDFLDELLDRDLKEASDRLRKSLKLKPSIIVWFYSHSYREGERMDSP